MKNRRIPSLLAAAGIAATLAMSASGQATLQTAAPQFLGAWSTADSPYAVAVNPQGDVWVAYADTPRVVRYDTAGHQQVSLALDPSDSPLGIATDAAGNAYVTDNNNSTVLVVSRGGQLTGTWSNVVGSPSGIALSPSGNVFVVDGDSDVIRVLTTSGASVTTIHPSTQITPEGVATDGAGNAYVTDLDGGVVLKYAATGGQLASFGAGFGSGSGQFDLPAFDAVDGGGNLFVTDENNNRIQEFSSSGSVLNAWGSGGNGNGSFTNPLGIAVDVAGNVYVADEGNTRIQKFFTGLDPCGNLFAPHLAACQSVRTACMAKLAPQDEATCLNAANQQFAPFRGVRAADHVVVTVSPADARVKSHVAVKVKLTAAGSPAGGRELKLKLTSSLLRVSGVTVARPSAVTSSAGLATFTVTGTSAQPAVYRVSIVDVTDGKTFTNAGTIRFG